MKTPVMFDMWVMTRFLLLHGTHCHKNTMQWFENTMLSDFPCLALKQNLDGGEREVETVVLRWVMMQNTAAVDWD